MTTCTFHLTWIHPLLENIFDDLTMLETSLLQPYP